MRAPTQEILLPEMRGEAFDPEGLDVRGELITAEVAEFYLSFNTHNRSPKGGHIDHVARAILREEWFFNGETIVFSLPTGEGNRPQLLDGQNRLRAVIEAQKIAPDGKVIAVPTLVVRGIDPEALYTIDGVVKRSVADALNLEGFVNTTNLGATANLVYAWEIGEQALRNRSRHRLTAPQAVKLVHDQPEIQQALREAERIHRKLVGMVPMSLVAACWWKFAQIDESTCRDFFGSLASGLELTNTDPRYALRRALTRNYQSTTKRPPLIIHAWLIKAWNYYRGGQHVENIVWRGTEPFPDPQ